MNGDILQPLQYPLTWAFIAGSLILLATAFYIILLLMTRKVKTNFEVTQLPDEMGLAHKLSAIKNKYAQNILFVQQQYDEGSITTRKAFQSISVHLRNFSHEYSQTGAFAMTLTDMQQNNAPVVLETKIRNIYPVAFQEAELNANVHKATQDALEVIQLWH